MWLGNLWTAGDSKLFIAYAALMPLSIYNNGYIRFFPAMNLLINTFLPIFIAFFILLFVKTSIEDKKQAIKPLLEKKQLVNAFVSLFAIFWVVQLFFKYTLMPSNYIFNMAITIFIYSVLQSSLKKNFLLGALVIASIRVITDSSIYSLLFLEKFVGLVLFWFIFKGAIINLGKKAFSKEKKIEDLKVGDVIEEKVYTEYLSERSFKESQKHMMIENTFITSEVRPEGVSENLLKKVKEQQKEKKMMFKTIKVKETLPFAPFMFLGALLTIIAKGNILIWVMILLAKWGVLV